MARSLISEAHLQLSSKATFSAYVFLTEILSFIKRIAHVAKRHFGVVMVITDAWWLVQNFARGLLLHVVLHLSFHVVLI